MKSKKIVLLLMAAVMLLTLATILPVSADTCTEHQWNEGEIMLYPGESEDDTGVNWGDLEFGDSVQIPDTTEQAIKYTCMACGETKIELYHETHSYGNWKKLDDEIHERVCSCGKKETASHAWDEGETTVPPTHTSEGEKVYTCLDCGATKTVEIPITEAHEYGDWVNVDENNHKRTCPCGKEETASHAWDKGETTVPPTHTSEGEKVYTCLDCGTTKTEEIPKTEAHEYGDWVNVDENNHKRTCPCGKEETASHAWDKGETTVPPTHTTEGEKIYTCTGCGATKKEALAPSAHVLGAWSKVDVNFHKRSCTIEGCDLVEYAHHAWAIKTSDDMYIVGEGSGVGGSLSWDDLFSGADVGQGIYECTDCGQVYERDPDQLPDHIYSESWTPADDTNHQKTCPCGDVITEGHGFGDWTKVDGNSHKKFCSACGHTVTAAHAWNEGVITIPSTHTTLGVKTYTCTDCGATKTEDVAKTPAHEHGDWTPADDTNHQKTCPCGDVITEGHGFGDWTKVDGDSHKKFCSACGHTVTAAHAWNEGVVTDKASNTETGVITYTCTDCGATREEIYGPVSSLVSYNLYLGTDITVNCYAELTPEQVGAKVRFLMGGQYTVVEGVETETPGLYCFTFKGVAPQCIGDLITATLMLGDEVLDEQVDFSVRSYCLKVLGMSPAQLGVTESQYEQLTVLIADLLEYGAKAQIHLGYKTDALVNAGITGKSEFAPLGEDKKAVITESTLEGVRIKSAGIYHSYTNSLYVKVDVGTMNRADLEIRLYDPNTKQTTVFSLANADYDANTGTYIVLMNPVSTVYYESVYTISLYGKGEGEDALSCKQTLQYSVASYVYAMQSSADENAAELAKALYLYGQSAKAYKAAT